MDFFRSQFKPAVRYFKEKLQAGQQSEITLGFNSRISEITLGFNSRISDAGFICYVNHDWLPPQLVTYGIKNPKDAWEVHKITLVHLLIIHRTYAYNAF